MLSMGLTLSDTKGQILHSVSASLCGIKWDSLAEYGFKRMIVIRVGLGFINLETELCRWTNRDQSKEASRA